MDKATRQLLDLFAAGDKRALARILTYIENDNEQLPDILEALHGMSKGSRIIGITGSPGSGKSTLVDRLITLYRNKQKTIGIIAVDPTSPFTGGALLGDRIRMKRHFLDEGIFIRSTASRRSLGGLAPATYKMTLAMEAFGFDYIILETVGVGQSEVDVVYIADLVCLVLTPSMGDEVQGLKAGIMEIADIFVVNKADLEGTERLITELNSLLEFSESEPKPSIVPTVSTENKGIAELEQAISEFIELLAVSDRLKKRRRERLKKEFHEEIKGLLNAIRVKSLQEDSELAALEASVLNDELSPYTGARRFIKKLGLSS